MPIRKPPGRLAAQLAAAVLLGSQALAQQPDLAFLEYLGSFEENDEDWYVDVQMREPTPATEATDADRGENSQSDEQMAHPAEPEAPPPERAAAEHDND